MFPAIDFFLTRIGFAMLSIFSIQKHCELPLKFKRFITGFSFVLLLFAVIFRGNSGSIDFKWTILAEVLFGVAYYFFLIKLHLNSKFTEFIFAALVSLFCILLPGLVVYDKWLHLNSLAFELLNVLTSMFFMGSITLIFFIENWTDSTAQMREYATKQIRNFTWAFVFRSVILIFFLFYSFITNEFYESILYYLIISLLIILEILFPLVFILIAGKKNRIKPLNKISWVTLASVYFAEFLIQIIVLANGFWI